MINNPPKAGFTKMIKHFTEVSWKNFPIYFAFVILINALAGFSTAAIALFKQLFFDSVNQATTSTGSINSPLFYGVLMSIVMVVVLFLMGMSDIMKNNLMLRLQGALGMNLNEKASKVEPICFENKAILDKINKANKGIKSAGLMYSAFLNIVVYSVPYFIFMAIYLYYVKPILILCILFAFVPSFIGQIIRFKAYANLENEVAPLRRKYEYYEQCINDREYSKETRLIGGFWFFRTLYTTALELTCKTTWNTNRRLELMELKIRFFLLIGYLGTIYLTYIYLIRGEISIGMFAAVFSTVDQLFDFMEYAVSRRVMNITEGMGLVQNYMFFLELPERTGKEQDLKLKEIALKNVSFSYPNTNKLSLNNINLDIKDGETLAIVGVNGSGKSTLVKLITGLYLPDEGSIFIDGIDTKTIAPASIYKHISGVFQRFQKYKMPLKDNLIISQSNRDNHEEHLNSAIKKSEIDLSDRSYTEGLNTMLSREFGGIDISGGQWQKIAIGRGFYRTHNLLVLDEPTAAIDPIEETRIYTQFAEMSKGKTSIIVTHRLGSAKIADRIIVMSHGNIIDIGTHDELIDKEGLYKTMYEFQAKWYA
ncbi:ATP-binding cassette subfamily B protein [Natranaerovirga pectinivora]|uniref:ATP-binding cassette subfamily B protein n=1 Tax=Natranaerovirga pectinivora TaxID=682400 RepID=A0A4R3MPF8_9FIRM|nr:ABC transporter ATP-binding protein [Natranaerovirga pectinivora]TCT17187.1 ATP-binding cassette subfamily B protein [Natranaerovirga pectinivora]